MILNKLIKSLLAIIRECPLLYAADTPNKVSFAEKVKLHATKNSIIVNIKRINSYHLTALQSLWRTIAYACIITMGLNPLSLDAAKAAAREESKLPRLIVLTDIGDDPDDEQSLVRLLVYANAFDIEGFVTELWWKDTHKGRHGVLTPDRQMELLHKTLDLQGIGGQFMPHFPEGLGVDVSIFSRIGIERIAHYAFKLAQSRRKNLVAVTKSNTLINSLTFWDRVIAEVAEQYPDVKWRYMYIDNCSANFVLRPEQFDVVLTTNLFGDILSDLGGAVMGSLGLGGSGNINPEKEYPSMFEPIHGSAPDIAGRNIANPIGTIWSGAMMLEHLGESQAADRIMQAVDAVCSSGILTFDLGGETKTHEFAEAVIDKL